MERILKIAIVGTSHAMTENEERDVQQFVAMILKDFSPKTNMIISGGAKGVDSIAIEVARSMGFPTVTYHPENQEWEPKHGKGYKERNMQIAIDCNQLFCISIPTHEIECYHHKKGWSMSIPDHEKTAGCWTMKHAIELDKQCRLLVTPSR